MGESPPLGNPSKGDMRSAGDGNPQKGRKKSKIATEGGILWKRVHDNRILEEPGTKKRGKNSIGELLVSRNRLLEWEKRAYFMRLFNENTERRHQRFERAPDVWR